MTGIEYQCEIGNLVLLPLGSPNERRDSFALLSYSRMITDQVAGFEPATFPTYVGTISPVELYLNNWFYGLI